MESKIPKKEITFTKSDTYLWRYHHYNEAGTEGSNIISYTRIKDIAPVTGVNNFTGFTSLSDFNSRYTLKWEVYEVLYDTQILDASSTGSKKITLPKPTLSTIDDLNTAIYMTGRISYVRYVFCPDGTVYCMTIPSPPSLSATASTNFSPYRRSSNGYTRLLRYANTSLGFASYPSAYALS